MVGLPATLDAGTRFRRRKLPRVHRHAASRNSPHEAYPLRRLPRRGERLSPCIREKIRVDIREAAVRIDVAARKGGFDQRRTVHRCAAIEARDVRILRTPPSDTL